MKITEETVFRVLESFPEKGATVKEILSEMNQGKKRKALLRKVLRSLAKKNVCFKQDNHYFLREDLIKPEKNRGKGRQRSPRGKRQAYPDIKNRGIVIFKKRRLYVYSFDDRKEYPLRDTRSSDLLHGDIIRYAFAGAKSGRSAVELNGFLDRRINRIKGTVYPGKKGKKLFFADSRRFFREFNVTNSPAVEDEAGETAWLEITRHPLNKRLPEGNAIIPDRKEGVEDPMLEEILRVNKIPRRFPQKALQEAETFPGTVRFDPEAKRVDLRDLPFVTIDGADARDFDDAVYARPENNGFRIWVSIADVAEYVMPGSPMDQEAFCRGTSTYLPNAVFPMLPQAISNNLCSLRENRNRNTLTCEVLIDQGGNPIEKKVYQSTNKIACRLTYMLVDRYYQTGTIKSRKRFPDLAEQLTLYRKIKQVLEKRRMRAGYIDFNLPETVFDFDAENKVRDIRKTYQSEGMKVIEQFMLLANECVSRYCDERKIPIVWRNHPQPSPDKRNEIRTLLWNHSVRIQSLVTGKDYNIALKELKKHPQRDLLEYSLLRSMSLAVYETERKGHFGLALSHYCHFTSPIRRYPDLLVHRALKRYLRGQEKWEIPEFYASSASERERNATQAERSAAKILKIRFMEDKIGEFFDVSVIGIIKHGLFVEIDQPYVEGFVPIASLYDDFYEFDEQHQQFWAKHQKRKLTIGEQMRVLLTRVDWKNVSLEFDWIRWI